MWKGCFWNARKNIINFEDFFKRYSTQMNNKYPWIEMTMLNVKGVLLKRWQRYWGELEGSVGRRTSITITNVIYNGSKLRNFLFEAALNKRSLAEQETPQRCSIKISSNHLQRPLTPSDQALESHENSLTSQPIISTTYYLSNWTERL